eukprot:2811788-Alexandrium_andersonii.AAC.1
MGNSTPWSGRDRCPAQVDFGPHLDLSQGCLEAVAVRTCGPAGNAGLRENAHAASCAWATSWNSPCRPLKLSGGPRGGSTAQALYPLPVASRHRKPEHPP